jgi:8-oxo-dGTP pyrophosphatase MutT (NUDIX family)
MFRAELIRSLADYRARYPEESATIERFEAFVRSEPRCFERDCWSGHVTGSAWVVDAPGALVLLTHHRKLNRWLQLGGHCDGDVDPLRVACREAVEESGLVVTPLSATLFDIDIHSIPARGSDPMHLHFDARFVFRIVGSDRYRVSDESHALSWVPIDAIESLTVEPSMLRMARKWLHSIERGLGEDAATGVYEP